MSGASELIVVGLSHRSAPLPLREKLAVAPDSLEAALAELRAMPAVAEALLLSTCNRVEVYAAGEPARALASVREHFLRRAGGPEAAPHLYQHTGDGAVRHLFRVAVSLESLVVGEPQILGQVKSAYDSSVRAGAVGPTLGALFQRAFRVARKVRRETDIGKSSVSVASIAVDLARQVFAGFEGRAVLVIGAGEMAAEAARAFRTRGASLTVSNRTSARADELAGQIGAAVHAWTDLGGAIERADIVLASTGAREPVVGRGLIAAAQKARRGRPLFLIDIAVPRDVDPACADLPGVFLADIDNLQTVAAEHLGERKGEAERAAAMVEDELRRLADAGRGRQAAPTISALRAHFHEITRQAAVKLLDGLPPLGDRERHAIEASFETLANRLLHAPQMALKKDAAASEGAALMDAVQELFNLTAAEVAPAAAAPEPDESDDTAEADRPEDAHGSATPKANARG